MQSGQRKSFPNESAVEPKMLFAAVENEKDQKARFETELEFVQCLANPNYLNCKWIVSFLTIKNKIVAFVFIQFWLNVTFLKIRFL